MNEYDSFEIILHALMKLGYSEDEAASMIIQVIEEQKRFDNISFIIHKMIEEEISNPNKWS